MCRGYTNMRVLYVWEVLPCPKDDHEFNDVAES